MSFVDTASMAEEDYALSGLPTARGVGGASSARSAAAAAAKAPLPLPRGAKAALAVAVAALCLVLLSHSAARSVTPVNALGRRGAALRAAASVAAADPTVASIEAARVSGAAVRYLDPTQFDALLDVAAASPRLRAAFDFTLHPEHSTLQRLLNVWQPGSYAQPHAHTHDEARAHAHAAAHAVLTQWTPA